MKQTKTRFPSKAKVISWLESQKPGRRFECRSPWGCLFAIYIREHGFPDAQVGTTEWTTSATGIIADVPKWATNIICKIDDRNSGITAAHALKILRSK